MSGARAASAADAACPAASPAREHDLQRDREHDRRRARRRRPPRCRDAATAIVTIAMMPCTIAQTPSAVPTQNDDLGHEHPVAHGRQHRPVEVDVDRAQRDLARPRPSPIVERRDRRRRAATTTAATIADDEGDAARGPDEPRAARRRRPPATGARRTGRRSRAGERSAGRRRRTAAAACRTGVRPAVPRTWGTGGAGVRLVRRRGRSRHSSYEARRRCRCSARS